VSLGTHPKDRGKGGSDDLSSSIHNPNDTPAKAAVDTSPVVEPNVSTMAVETVREDENGVEVSVPNAIHSYD
jgi:hypothetical protein